MNANLKFDTTTGLIPAIVQDSSTGKILMQAYMNQESFNLTLETKKLTFFSRSRNQLWTKGETSGNFLELVSWSTDCDQDSLLFQAKPQGPTCHLGTESCFGETPAFNDYVFIKKLEGIIDQRFSDRSDKKSYVKSLIESGLDKIIQKVGEEAIETVIAAKNPDDKEFVYETADLIFHLLVLLRAKKIPLKTILDELEKRHKD